MSTETTITLAVNLTSPEDEEVLKNNKELEDKYLVQVSTNFIEHSEVLKSMLEDYEDDYSEFTGYLPVINDCVNMEVIKELVRYVEMLDDDEMEKAVDMSKKIKKPRYHTDQKCEKAVIDDLKKKYKLVKEDDKGISVCRMLNVIDYLDIPYLQLIFTKHIAYLCRECVNQQQIDKLFEE